MISHGFMHGLTARFFGKRRAVCALIDPERT
jgi:hypothetical protein